MKGVVFTEFLDAVEKQFGYETVDAIIGKSNLPNDGAYTAVGTYNHNELLTLITHLSVATSKPVSELVKGFGKYLFGSLVGGYPALLENATTSVKLLTNIDSYIHVEVRKLYPEAELPDFSHEFVEPDQLVLTYHSTRPFADLAEGLIVACAEHYGDEIELQRLNIEDKDNRAAIFTLRYKNGMPDDE